MSVADDILIIGNRATTAEAVKDHNTKLDHRQKLRKSAPAMPQQRPA